MIRPWRTVSRRVLLRRPPWFTVGEETVELPDGRVVADFNWIDMLEFAVIVPLTDAGDAVLVRSYKHGLRAVSLSLPAGGLQAGEAPLAGAQRELREETGYAADTWTDLGRYIVDANYGCGTMHAFLARGARRTQRPESGDLEEQELVVLPWADVVASLRRGEITQLSTAAALGLAAAILRDESPG